MSHSSITYNSGHGGIYHSSHALEGGSAAGDGRIKAWYPDKFNRKIVVVTFENVELWDMDGGGYDSEILSDTIETQDTPGLCNTSANYDHTSFFNNGICYNYSGTIAYNGQTDTYWDAITASTGRIIPGFSPSVILWNGYPYGQRAVNVFVRTNDDPQADVRRAEERLYYVDESGTKTLISLSKRIFFTDPSATFANGLSDLQKEIGLGNIDIRAALNAKARYAFGIYTSGKAYVNYNSYQYIDDENYSEIWRGEESSSNFPNNAPPLGGVLDHFKLRGSDTRLVQPKFLLDTTLITPATIERAPNSYPIQNNLPETIYQGYSIESNWQYKNPQSDSDHILLTDNSKWYYGVINNDGTTESVTEIRSSIPTRSSAIIGTYWFGEGYLYFDHKDSGTGDDLISRIDLSNGVEEELIRLIP